MKFTKATFAAAAGVLLLALVCMGAHAQAVAAQTWDTVAKEGDTVTAAAAITYRYGVPQGTTGGGAVCTTAAGCWDPAVTSAGPVTVTVANSTFGTDPAAYITKTLQVLEGPAAQTVTVNGGAVTVPAAVGVAAASCSAPTTFNANPVAPAAPQICPPLAGMTAVAGDGNTVVNWRVSTPVILQYCSTANAALCSPPFMLIDEPIAINPRSVWMGGDPNPAAAGHTLFALNMVLPNTLIYTADADATHTPVTVTVPAASAGN